MPGMSTSSSTMATSCDQRGFERLRTVVEAQRHESGGRRRFGKQQSAEILIVRDDGERLRGAVRGHALSFNWRRVSSSISGGCAARTVS